MHFCPLELTSIILLINLRPSIPSINKNLIHLNLAELRAAVSSSILIDKLKCIENSEPWRKSSSRYNQKLHFCPLELTSIILLINLRPSIPSINKNLIHLNLAELRAAVSSSILIDKLKCIENSEPWRKSSSRYNPKLHFCPLKLTVKY